MTKYQIYANMTEPSVYEAETEEAAILLWVQDAGYADVASAADVCNQTVEAFLAETHIEQVSE